MGLLFNFEVCEGNTSWPTSPPGNRNDYIKDKLKLYENYWDLTQNNGFTDNVLTNPCLRQQELGLTSHFTKDVYQIPPFPSDQGWITVAEETSVFSDPLDFSDSHQFTM